MSVVSGLLIDTESSDYRSVWAISGFFGENPRIHWGNSMATQAICPDRKPRVIRRHDVHLAHGALIRRFKGDVLCYLEPEWRHTSLFNSKRFLRPFDFAPGKTFDRNDRSTGTRAVLGGDVPSIPLERSPLTACLNRNTTSRRRWLVQI